MTFRQIHLDFHTSEKIDGIGEEFNKENFQKALILGHVDSITLFSKCHHGYAYHPSKANEMHPGLKFDLLKAQIDAAHEIGVKTPVYISAGYDERVLRLHPQWRFEKITHEFANFQHNRYQLLCFNTPYLDLLLEQIKEVCENYDADGIFMDICAVRPCCCNECMKGMLEIGMNPNNPEDLLRWGKITYKKYLRRVREAIDSVKPGLPVFHNGGHIIQGDRDVTYQNTHLELESLPTGGWGYDHFPFSAKYAQTLDRQYLGMTGKFHTSWGEFGGYKHPNALRYEVSLCAAMGAKSSVGDQLAPNGKMDLTTYELIGTAYKELEEKEPWLDNVTHITDVAILSKESSYNDSGLVYTDRMGKSDVGAGRMMLEGKYMFSVIDCLEELDKYKVIIIPEEDILSDTMIGKLKKYTENGGKILASGNSVVRDNQLIFDFGGEYEGESEFNPSYARPSHNNEYETDYILYSKCNKIKKINGAELVKVIEPYYNRTPEHFCSHKHFPSSGSYGGAGVIAGKDGIYIAWDIFSEYASNGDLTARKIVCDALDILLCGNKSLVTDLGSMGVVSLMDQKKENRLVAHFLYAVPTKRGEKIEIIEDIYPVYDIKGAVKMDKSPSKVYLAPQNKEIDFEYKNNYVNFTLEKIDCHQMVVIDY